MTRPDWRQDVLHDIGAAAAPPTAGPPALPLPAAAARPPAPVARATARVPGAPPPSGAPPSGGAVSGGAASGGAVLDGSVLGASVPGGAVAIGPVAVGPVVSGAVVGGVVPGGVVPGGVAPGAAGPGGVVPGGGPGETPEWLAPLAGRPPRGDPLARRIARAATQLLGVHASRDTHGLAEQLVRVQQTVITPRRILIGGLAGGAGTTTLAALLCAAFARYRPDGVLALDVNGLGGSLEFRLGHAVHWPAAEVSALPQLSPQERAALLAGRAGRLCVLPRPDGLSLAGYWAASTHLARFFALAVLDGGVEAITDGSPLGHAHATVVAVPATVDGMRRALDWLRMVHPALRPQILTVLVSRVPNPGVRPARALESLHSLGFPVFWLPYDRNLATGGMLLPDQLAASTKQASTGIAGIALSVANGARR